MHCGNCMAVCPVYATDKTEAGVARGKVMVAQAVLEGELGLDEPEVVEMLFNCLVCKSCIDVYKRQSARCTPTRLHAT